MVRGLPIAGLVALFSVTGCAGTWDALSARSMRTDTFGTLKKAIAPEDAVVVLLADPPKSGNDRASAMRRLKEPLRNGGDQQTQDAILDVLAKSATADLSPVLRLSAVEALGEFQDPRAAGLLVMAYNEAHGRPAGATPAATPHSGVIPASGSRPADRMLIADRSLLAGPTGFSPDTVSAIRCRALESLGRTRRPEGVNFLAHVATAGRGGKPPEGSEDRDVRLAAVRGLAQCRQPEAVQALAEVMAREHNKDGALVGRSHDGLVRLTGKDLPPDPQKWNEIIQAGNVQIAPEPNWVQQAVEWVTH